ncbi:MAG: enoyl-CoA hydratase/isomerase family protein [Rhodococcus erythropolis]|nr:enoyl-CoA hydratase-related protein [Rhodococcus erythropolis]MDF2895904.1 enoyl-CoA hydratase/isomerase family protein [Rhodococcus erythropolis]
MKNASELDLETITVAQDGRVLTARYASPPLNFATTAFIRDLDILTATADRDDTVGAIVLTGGVNGRFLTHADPTELGGAAQTPLPALSMRAMRPLWRLTRTLLRAPGALRATESVGGQVGAALAWGYRWRRTILRMNHSSSVYIAAINGPTTGGGHEIALACDLRFVSDAPHIRLGQIESLVGLIPGGGGTQRLPKMIGTAHALEHMLEGAPLTAERAHRLGLANAVVPDADLVAHAQQTATRLARRSPVAVQAIKELTYFTNSRPLGAGLDTELAGFLTAALQPSMKATLDAFTADLDEQHDSPLVTDTESWLDGTRVDQTS